MTLVTRAVIFAAEAHDGALRKGSARPYIVHPMEAGAVAASITEDEEIIAAALLHDVAEDCGVTQAQLQAQFGARVAALVMAETQIKDGDPEATWDARKSAAIDALAHSDYEAKVVALSDKLSNMRAIARDFERVGEAMFDRFHQRDKRRHAWYYRSCMALLEGELGQTQAWREFHTLVNQVFGEVDSCGKKEENA